MPPGPVGVTVVRSTPRSRASLRTGGLVRTGYPSACGLAAGAVVRGALPLDEPERGALGTPLPAGPAEPAGPVLRARPAGLSADPPAAPPAAAPAEPSAGPVVRRRRRPAPGAATP